MLLGLGFLLLWPGLYAGCSDTLGTQETRSLQENNTTHQEASEPEPVTQEQPLYEQANVAEESSNLQETSPDVNESTSESSSLQDTAAVEEHPPESATEAMCVQPNDPTIPELTKASLDPLRQSIIDLQQDWLFQQDPKDEGITQGWFAENDSEQTWKPIHAGKTWESQGYPGYDGVAWYRKWVTIPTSWQGAAVRLEASGVDDEYDLYVNGQWVKHHGQHPDRSVWNWRTKTRIDPYLRFGQKNLITLRVRDWGDGGGIWRGIVLRHALPLTPYRSYLPTPVLDSQPTWIALYWEAWRMAWEKVSFGTSQNGFVAAYMDEGFNEQIYQWDSSFITMFGRYGLRLFPVMPTLDNFYRKQRPDGYIQRVYSETTGQEAGSPSVDEPMVNPPLFSWVEWDYYRFSGDQSRLAHVFPRLEAYFAWLKNNLRKPPGKGLYFQTDLGSGMDNTPRNDVTDAAWIDMSSQQALNAWYLWQMAALLQNTTAAQQWEKEYNQLKTDINQWLWHETDGFYYDLLRSGQLAQVKHIGGFWPLLAGIASITQAQRLLAHLKNPQEFFRPHLFPTLSASDSRYAQAGHYWRGSVWAPTNYMVVAGLRRYGFRDFARQAAENHIDNLVKVYLSSVDPKYIAPEEQDDNYNTLWECYSAESAKPATRWDNTYYSRQDFVGWTGLGPIAMLIEDVVGFEVVGADHTIIWHLSRTDRHGVQNLPLGTKNLVDLIAEARSSLSAPVSVHISAKTAFTLIVKQPGKPEKTMRVCSGTTTLQIP